MKKVFGFTLIEILVTSAIIALLAGGGLAAYLDFNNRQILDTTANELKNNLRQARGWAMAGRKMGDCAGDLVGYKVSFSTGSYTIKVACSSDDEVADDEVAEFTYDDKITMSFSPSSLSSFGFKALTGEEINGKSGTITLSLGSRSKELRINSNGEINYGDD
jgi:prepilin-type N-terminal cleavage/methylation domain-containing protein